MCLRPFGDPSNLNKHVRLHAEGDTPYRCDHCGKVLVRRRDLERHIRSRHPDVAGGGAEHAGNRLEEGEEEGDGGSTECADSEIDVISEAESDDEGVEGEVQVI